MILIIDNAVEGGYMAGEVVRLLPTDNVEKYNYPNEDGDPSLDGVDGVVIGGSSAGVYEAADHPWITREKEFVERVVDEGIPLFGICFGHQLINEALGGTVVDSGVSRAHLVQMQFGDDDLFDDVTPVVPVLHSDVVTETGDGMETIATAEYYEHFATRHESHPIWSVQYHPEFTPEILPKYREAWTENELSFDDSEAARTLTNFYRSCSADTDTRLAQR